MPVLFLLRLQTKTRVVVLQKQQLLASMGSTKANNFRLFWKNPLIFGQQVKLQQKGKDNCVLGNATHGSLLN